MAATCKEDSELGTDNAYLRKCDALSQYMREIGKVKLLTPQEEKDLAQRIKQGDKGARDRLIKANLWFVVSVAQMYRGMGLSLLDLIGEGNVGLITAVNHFSPERGARLTTYSKYWIRQHFQIALAHQARTIRLPVHLIIQLRALERHEEKFYSVRHREPTENELAKSMRISMPRLRYLREIAQAHVAVSLDETPSDRTEGTIGDLMADENARNPYKELERHDSYVLLHEVIGSLLPRDAEIIRLRFGLDGRKQLTLEGIGRLYHLTHERVRQIVAESLMKIRSRLERLERPSPYLGFVRRYAGNRRNGSLSSH